MYIHVHFNIQVQPFNIKLKASSSLIILGQHLNELRGAYLGKIYNECELQLVNIYGPTQIHTNKTNVKLYVHLY